VSRVLVGWERRPQNGRHFKAARGQVCSEVTTNESSRAGHCHAVQRHATNAFW
jgi:hypothetical protein